jgi:hypothetical protein
MFLEPEHCSHLSCILQENMPSFHPVLFLKKT